MCAAVCKKSVLVLRRPRPDWNWNCGSSDAAVVSVSNVNISTTQTVCLSASQWECGISGRDAAKCFKSERMRRWLLNWAEPEINMKVRLLALGMGTVFTEVDHSTRP